MALLQIENLTFRYPQAEESVLDGVSFFLEEGEFAVLCGASGCGKTTLLRLLKRELSPHGERGGALFYNGRAMEELDDRTAAGEIGFVMQNPESQAVTDKVWHELSFGLESLGEDPAVIRRRVAEMASYFGIQEWFRKDTAALSGGQKQLLNLASVMAMQPRLLLLDEPTSQLDPIAASEFIRTLQKLNRELGLTILLVEHRLEEIFPAADRVLVMEKGRLLLNAPPAAVGPGLRELRPEHPLLEGLPAAVRLYQMLEAEGPCPLTVRDGRRFLSERYGNGIKELPREPDTPREETVLEAKGVWFRYEKDLPDVLRGVSLRVHRGEAYCLLGGNGTGKTTTLQVLAGLDRPYRGKVLVGGKKIAEYKNGSLYRKNLALLPQNPQDVFIKKTVREDYAELGPVMGYSKQELRERIDRVAEQVGIVHLLDRHPYDLSGGEQQKAALAKMLLLQPAILLMDEPTKGIDAGAKRNLAGILEGLKAQGITLLIVTHDVEFAARTADRCALFFDGEIVSEDTPSLFFSGNSFYTTAANRLSRHRYRGAVTCEEVAQLCRLNGPEEEER